MAVTQGDSGSGVGGSKQSCGPRSSSSTDASWLWLVSSSPSSLVAPSSSTGSRRLSSFATDVSPAQSMPWRSRKLLAVRAQRAGSARAAGRLVTNTGRCLRLSRAERCWRSQIARARVWSNPWDCARPLALASGSPRTRTAAAGGPAARSRRGSRQLSEGSARTNPGVVGEPVSERLSVACRNALRVGAMKASSLRSNSLASEPTSIPDRPGVASHQRCPSASRAPLEIALKPGASTDDKPSVPRAPRIAPRSCPSRPARTIHGRAGPGLVVGRASGSTMGSQTITNGPIARSARSPVFRVGWPKSTREAAGSATIEL